MNKKLKIAIIGSRGYPYVYSGYETLVKELSERLVIKGHDVRVYCHSSLFKNKPKNVNGVKLIYTPSIETKSLSQLINSFFSFIHVCFSSYNTVLVLNAANGPFGLLTKIFMKKTFINVDGLEWLRPKWKGLGGIYFRLAAKLSTFFFDVIITDSDQMKKIYQDQFKRNSTVIAYGSSIKKKSKKNLLSNWKLDKNGYYLVVGRLIPDNNSMLLIKGFIESNSKKKLVIVGDVPYKDKYASSVKRIRNKNLVFTGYVKNDKILSELYHNCFAYIHGHEFGGTNPTMINALSSNCKILALNTRFTIEMLKGRNAIFFKKNINDITNKLNFFESNFSKFDNNNFLLPDKYKWDYIVKSYIKIFNY